MNELVTIIQGEQMSDSNNDLQFTTSELNELAYSIGQDFSLSDIGDIHAVNESVNSEKSSVLQHDDDTGQEMVHHSHQHQDHSDQQHGHSNQHNNIDLDMDTIVIETINNEMDMNDAVVFDNVANEVSISSTGNDKSLLTNKVINKLTIFSFDLGNLANTGSMANAQSGQRLTQKQQIKPAKIRAPTAQQQQQQLSRQSNQIQQRQSSVGTTQPQIISSFNLNQIGQGTQLFTVVPQKQLQQQQQKGKVIKKSPIITSGLANQEPGSTLKVIYTSQGQQIVFSPSKTATTTGSGSVNLINTNATGNKVIAIGNGSSTGKLISLPGTSSPSGKVLIKPVGDTKTVSSSGQPQQVIILSSPIKTSATTGTVSSPIVQTGKLISSQSKSPQRPLAPAPPVPKIAISKSTTSTITSDGKSVQLIRVVPVSTSQTLQASGSFTQASKFIPLRPIAPNTKDGTGIGLAGGSTSGTGMHKVLVPASALKALSGTPISVNSGSNQVSQGTLLAATGPGGTGQVFMLPNTPLLKIASPSGTVQAVSAVTSKTVTFAATSTPLITSQRTNFVPIAPSPITANSTVGLTGHLNQMKITNG